MVSIQDKYNPKEWHISGGGDFPNPRTNVIYFSDLEDFKNLRTNVNLAIKNGWIKVQSFGKSGFVIIGHGWIVEHIYDSEAIGGV